MISRRTVFSFLLMLLIASGVQLWKLNHVDDCSRAADHLGQLPASVYVESGDRTVEMPCTTWFPRQPIAVQFVCLLDLVVGVVFVLSVWTDWVRARDRRRGRWSR